MPTVTEQGLLQLPHYRPIAESHPPSVIKVIDVNTLVDATPKPSFFSTTAGKLLIIGCVSLLIIIPAILVPIALKVLKKSDADTTVSTTTVITTTTTGANATITPCPVGYTGVLCTTPLCNGAINGCANGGTCSAPSVCTCPTGWIGSSCSTATSAVCPCVCSNGGTCLSNNTCGCTSQYQGTCCTSIVFSAIWWRFDGNLNDYYGIFVGATDSGRPATYVSPGYTGYGSALSLGLHGTYQSVSIATFVSIWHTSFTLEAWIYPTAFSWTYGGSPDNALFGQCQAQTTDQCLHIILRSQRIYFGFYADDLQGSITFQPNRWYHVTYAYEQTTRQQYTYVNGVNDGQRTSNQYDGQTGSFTIGMSTQINSPNNYFQGYFDEMTLVAYCKTAAQILDDATHVVYYKFDTSPGLTGDSGPLSITGISSGVSLVGSPAKANQSLYFPSGTNYYQFQGLTYFGESGWPYSMSLWIYPTSSSGGTIIQASGGYATNGAGTTGWCLPMLGFSSSGVLYAQSTSSTSVVVYVAGTTTTLNTWTYVAITYSTTNGMRLYINNVLRNSTAAFTFISSGTQNTITLGNGLTGASSTYCPQGSITSGQFQGYIDSFSLYSRELTTTEINTLYVTPQP